MKKYNLICAVYGNKKFKLDTLAEQYNIFFEYTNSIFVLIDNSIKHNLDFILIDSNLKLSESEMTTIKNIIQDKERIKFVSDNDNNFTILDIENYSDYFFELRKRQLDLNKNTYLESKIISEFLKKLQIDPKLIGFTYLKESILFTFFTKSKNLESCIYPQIARKHNVSVNSIKRSISNMLYTRYTEDTKILWSELLDFEPIKNYCPSVKEFILLIVEKLTDEYM